MSESRLTIKNVRFSYAHVFQPDENEKYSVAILIRKDDPQVPVIKNAIENAVREGAGKLGPRFRLDITKVLHDGDVQKLGDEAYAGCFYLNAKSARKPAVVKLNTTGVGGHTMAITDEDEFYSGCYGAANVGFFAYSTQGNAGIGCGLNSVLKLKDGERLGGSSVEADYGDVAKEAIEQNEEEEAF